MTTQLARDAALIARAGRLLYGEEWTGRLAADLGLNERTMRRIKAANTAGRDYPIAPGVFDDLKALLVERSGELQALARAF